VASSTNLRGERVLVVEDEPLIAMDVAQAIEEAGGQVVGPADNLADAKQLAGGANITAAMLDIQLHQAVSADVAAILAGRNIPFVFYSGYNDSDVSRAWPNVALVIKPVGSTSLVEALQEMIVKRRAADRAAAHDND